MRIAERRLIAPFLSKLGERADYVETAPAQQLEPASHQEQIGVVGDVGAGGSEVNERLRGGSDVTESVDMSHHVVPEPFLVRGDRIEIDLVEGCPHLADRVLGNGDSQLALRFGEGKPQAAPKSMARRG